MLLPKFEYFDPRSMDDAISIADHCGDDAGILAGGTDLLVSAKLGNCKPVYIINLNKINALKKISYNDTDGMKIGALCPIQNIARDPIVNDKYPALAQAAALVGSLQLRNIGTIGGNICLNTRCFYYNQTTDWRQSRQACFKMGGKICHVLTKGKKCFAVFSADTPPILIALGARLKIMNNRGERVIPIKEFYTGDGRVPNILLPGEILTEIHLPPPSPGQASIYLKYRLRGSIDFPLAGIAASIIPNGGKKCLKAGIVLNALGSGPVSLEDAETLIEESNLSDDTIQEVAGLSQKAAHPMDNAESTPEFRKKMAGILAYRALDRLSKILMK